MDEPNGSRLAPEPADEHSVVLSMLTSDAWQQRLDEAREARARILAQRGAKPATPMPRNPYLAAANAPELPRLVLDSPAEPEEEEEFPDFEADTPDNTPPRPPNLAEAAAIVPPLEAASLPLAALSPDRPWAHVRPVGPARAVEPPHSPPPLTAAPELAPVRRPARIAAGFAVGLAAGAGAASLVWLLGFGALPQAPAPTEAVVAAPPAVPVPQVVPQVVPVTVLTPDPPKAASNLPGASGLAALVAEGPDVLKFRAMGSLSAAAPPLPLLGAVALPEAAQMPITAPAPLPIAQTAPPPFAPTGMGDTAARLPQPLTRQAPGRSAPVPDAADRDQEPAAITAPPALVLAAPVAPVEPTALPLHRVLVMAPTSIPDAQLSSDLARLSAEGFALDATERVSYTVKANHVRYYHPQDREMAQSLAASAGGDARDFTASDRDPPPGTLELFLQGSAPQPIRAAKPKAAKPPRQAQARATVPQAPREDPALRELRDRIVRKLQRGDHL